MTLAKLLKLPLVWSRGRSLTAPLLAARATAAPGDDALDALAREGQRALQDGTALRAGDIDVAGVYGLGLPKFCGGPMFRVEQAKAEKSVATVAE